MSDETTEYWRARGSLLEPLPKLLALKAAGFHRTHRHQYANNIEHQRWVKFSGAHRDVVTLVLINCRW